MLAFGIIPISATERSTKLCTTPITYASCTNLFQNTRAPAQIDITAIAAFEPIYHYRHCGPRAAISQNNLHKSIILRELHQFQYLHCALTSTKCANYDSLAWAGLHVRQKARSELDFVVPFSLLLSFGQAT
jgi:hypothetical protein